MVSSSRWRYSTPNVTAPAAMRTVYSGNAGTGSARYSIRPISLQPPLSRFARRVLRLAQYAPPTGQAGSAPLLQADPSRSPAIHGRIAPAPIMVGQTTTKGWWGGAVRIGAADGAAGALRRAVERRGHGGAGHGG